MSPETISVLIALAAFVLLMAARVPVAFVLLVSGAMGLIALDGTQVAASSMARVPYQTIGKATLIVVPMFIAMGMFAKEAKLAERLFDLMRRRADRVPGGLAAATIACCAGFGAVSGSSVASVAAIGRLSIGEMIRSGYRPEFAGGTVAAGGTLGILIPPSIALVIYGQVTEESIGSLLIAGIVPGIISAAAMIGYVVARATLDPAAVGRPPRRERGATAASPPADALGADAWMPAAGDPVLGGRSAVAVISRLLILFAIVIGGIYLGVATPSESAAFGALAALLIMLYDLRAQGGRGLLRATGRSLRASADLTVMIFALLFGASIFSTFIVRSGMPRDFSNWVIGIDMSPQLVVILMLAVLIPLGMFVDGISMIVISMPLAYPVISELGYDGIWFGILAIKLIELGLITPPLGMNVFVAASTTTGLTPEQVFRGTIPYYAVDLAVAALLFLVPSLVLWLPSYIG